MNSKNTRQCVKEHTIPQPSSSVTCSTLWYSTEQSGTHIARTQSSESPTRILLTLCYNPMSDQLAHILRRFHTELNQSLDNISGQTVLFDIDDGPVYKSRLAMLEPSSCPDYKHLVLNINVDWLQPYKHVQHSIGTIYASISNLPRQAHYQMENMLLVSVISETCRAHSNELYSKSH